MTDLSKGAPVSDEWIGSPIAYNQQGDRVRPRMSASGTKQTFPFAPHMSAFGGKADMMQTPRVMIFRFYSLGNCL